jgi:SAM-dependent methyltransferase
MTAREQRLVFGEVADSYDDVRAGYPAEIAEKIFGYVGGRVPVVEVGAGTGKGTAIFVAAGVRVTCVEPDPAMAAVLRGRFDGAVDVWPGNFEDWVPPAGGVPLLCSAQAWHWVDPATRWRLAHDALAPDGVMALFGHAYTFADADLERDLHAEYARLAPELLYAGDGRLESPEKGWFHEEMLGSGLFTGIESVVVVSTVPYPTARYRALLNTFSGHRMLEPARRAALHDALDVVADRHGGVVDVRLDTLLTTGRPR